MITLARITIGRIRPKTNGRVCFLLQKIAATSEGPHLLAVHLLQMPSGWALDAHQHPFWELLLVRSGTHTVYANGVAIKAGPGSFLIYPPGATHAERNEQAMPLEDWYVSFEYATACELICHGYDRDGRMREMVAWLHAERDAYGPAAEAFRSAIVRALWAERERIEARVPEPLVESVRRHMHAHMQENLRLADLAEVAKLTKYHFVRMYRQTSGLTPMRDLRRIRIEEARRLLVSTHLPLKAIAARVGIRDEYQLSRALKRHLGMSARTIRSTS